MVRTAARFAGVSLLLLLAHAASAVPDDDPVVDGMKASQWVDILKTETSARKRALAIAALGKVQAKYDLALPNIARSLKVDSSPAVRFQAASVIAGLDPAIAATVDEDLVTAVTNEKDARVRKVLVAALGRFNAIAKKAVDPLTTLLKDPSPEIRAATADALGRVGADAKAAAPALVPLLADQDRSVRLGAVFALGRIAPDDLARVASVLVRQLGTEKDAEIRREIVVSLGLLTDRTAPTVQAIANLLKDPDIETRRVAVRTLGRFGLDASSVADALLKVAETDKDKEMRIDAVRALGSAMGPALKVRATDLIRMLEKDDDFEVRLAIVEELGALGNAVKDHKEIMAALHSRQSDPQVKVREAATAAIRRIQKPPPPPDKKP